MGKGEIARYEQFLLFPQCFQKACFQGASKGVIVWEWVKVYVFTVVQLWRNCIHCVLGGQLEAREFLRQDQCKPAAWYAHTVFVRYIVTDLKSYLVFL